MGHDSKIGYPYLPAREPWRGRDVLQRAWRVTLAGPASDPGGDRRSGTRKRAWCTTLAGTADDPGGAQLWHSWQATLAGTADDPGGARERPGADGPQRTPQNRRGRSSLDGGVETFWRAIAAGTAQL